MKKGLSYVDWSISVGLFIVYLLVLFILLAPAFQSSYSSDYLNKILKNGLDENIELELKRFPVYVKTDGLIGADKPFRINNLPQEFEDFYIEGEDNMAKLGIFANDGTREILAKDYGDEGRVIQLNADIGDILEDEGPIGEMEFYLSKEEIFIDYIEITDIASYAVFPGTVGVAETITGIYEETFNEFFPEDDLIRTHEIIKDELKYPDKDDFAIKVESLVEEGDINCHFTELTYEGKPIEDRDLVNTLVYSDWVIRINPNDPGVFRCPAQVTLQTW